LCRTCFTPHLLRYGVTAGVRNVTLTAVFDLTIGSALIGVEWVDYKYEFPPFILLDLLRTQVVSGCLLPISADQPSGVDATLTLQSAATLSDVERSALAFNLAMDVSAALGIDAKRVLVQLLDSAQRPLSHVAHRTVTLALPSVHDINGQESNQSASRTGRAVRAQAAATVSSAKVTVVAAAAPGEMGADEAARTINEQMALSQSELSRGVAARRFVPPGQMTHAYVHATWATQLRRSWQARSWRLRLLAHAHRHSDGGDVCAHSFRLMRL
jgi:hypothetical protein